MLQIMTQSSPDPSSILSSIQKMGGLDPLLLVILNNTCKFSSKSIELDYLSQLGDVSVKEYENVVEDYSLSLILLVKLSRFGLTWWLFDTIVEKLLISFEKYIQIKDIYLSHEQTNQHTLSINELTMQCGCEIISLITEKHKKLSFLKVNFLCVKSAFSLYFLLACFFFFSISICYNSLNILVNIYL